jgi:hypothetical protein
LASLVRHVVGDFPAFRCLCGIAHLEHVAVPDLTLIEFDACIGEAALIGMPLHADAWMQPLSGIGSTLPEGPVECPLCRPR